MGARGYEKAPDVVQLTPGRLDAPLRWTRSRIIFVNSMSDLFHPRVPYEFITEVFDVMKEASELLGHVFQALIKRPGRAVGWRNRNAERYGSEWPAGIWLGTSIESQKYAPRLTLLARIPAPVRFVSVEPLIGPVDLGEWLERGDAHWMIAGGESGPRARDMDIGWVRDLRDQCERTGTAFFLKQLGGPGNKRAGEDVVMDGRLWREYPAAA